MYSASVAFLRVRRINIEIKKKKKKKLNASGITASDEKIATVKNFPKPVTIKELRQFLDLVNYQRRFVENAAELLSPLQDYLKGKVKNETKISLNCNALQAFKKVKEITANLAYLAHPKLMLNYN